MRILRTSAARLLVFLCFSGLCEGSQCAHTKGDYIVTRNGTAVFTVARNDTCLCPKFVGDGAGLFNVPRDPLLSIVDNRTKNFDQVAVDASGKMYLPSGQFSLRGLDGFTLQTSDGTTAVQGLYSSLAIGNDGLAVVSFYDSINLDLKVAHCKDVACSAATVTTVDWVGDVGQWTSTAAKPGSLPLVSYYDATNRDLKVAVCADALCALPTITRLDGALSDVGQHSSAAISADSLGVVAYTDSTNGKIKVAKCSNALCTAAVVSTLDPAGGAALWPSIAVNPADGLPIVVYRVVAGQWLRVARCSVATCASATYQAVTSGVSLSDRIPLAIGADNLPVLVFSRDMTGVMSLVHCLNAGCTSTDPERTISASAASWPSVVIGAGLPVVVYRRAVSLAVYRCGNLACSNGTNAIVVASGVSQPAAVVPTDERPLVSYFDSGVGLSAVRCVDAGCSAVGASVRLADKSRPSLTIARNGRTVLTIDDSGSLQINDLVASSLSVNVQNSTVFAVSPTGAVTATNLQVTGPLTANTVQVAGAVTAASLSVGLNQPFSVDTGGNALVSGKLTVNGTQTLRTFPLDRDCNAATSSLITYTGLGGVQTSLDVLGAACSVGLYCRNPSKTIAYYTGAGGAGDASYVYFSIEGVPSTQCVLTHYEDDYVLEYDTAVNVNFGNDLIWGDGVTDRNTFMLIRRDGSSYVGGPNVMTPCAALGILCV